MDKQTVFCIGCGCAEHESCWWVRLDRPRRMGVCNDCMEFVKAWEAGERTFHVPIDQHSLAAENN